MLSYKLVLDNTTTNYRPEVFYVFKYIERCYLVERVNSDHADIIISYGASIDSYTDIYLPSKLIKRVLKIDSNGVSLVDKRPVIDALKSCMENNNGYITDSIGRKCFQEDLIALAFIFLSRVEERFSKSLDQHKRYKIDDDIVFRAGFYGSPVVDILIDKFIDIIFNGKAIKKVHYSVKLTHDIDRLRSYHSIWGSVRVVIGDIVKRMNPSLALARFRKELNLLEPWSSMYKLINIYNKLGFNALFLLMGPSKHDMDSTYFLRIPKLLKRYTRILLDNGHEIGFHPGYDSYCDEFIYNKQKKDIEWLLKVLLTSVRQHVLRFDIEQTPLISEKCGIENDYTLAYPELLGFRNGTSRGMHAFDFSNRKSMDLVLYPTSIVDFTLHEGKYNNLSMEEASKMADCIITFCKKYDGTLVILYHTGYMINKYFAFYKRLLHSL